MGRARKEKNLKERKKKDQRDKKYCYVHSKNNNNVLRYSLIPLLFQQKKMKARDEKKREIERKKVKKLNLEYKLAIKRR
jgi:hypothetical protein